MSNESSLLAAVSAAATPSHGADTPNARVIDASASQIATARADGRSEGIEAGRVDGATAERARISGILGHAEAKGRETMAQHLAFKTSMSVDDAAGLLAASERKSETAGKTPLERAMETQRTPNPGTGAGADQEREPVRIVSSDIYARRAEEAKKAASTRR